MIPLPHTEVCYHHIPHFPYGEFLSFQKSLAQRVRSSPHRGHIIFCNHPLTLTEGRGERQNRGGQGVLPRGLPIVPVTRGGGITIHGPHQVIFYPILRLTHRFGFNAYLKWLQESVINIVVEHCQIELEARRNPLGLWKGHLKYASVGIGIDRFITNHGLALNVEHCPLDGASLTKLSPCGLRSRTYSHLSALDKKIRVANFFDFLTRRF